MAKTTARPTKFTSLTLQTWSQPTIKGTPPAPRDSHSCTNVGDNLFVFGGTDGMNLLRDLHILDTSSHTWISPLISGERPEAREGHSAALVDKRLFFFFGKEVDKRLFIFGGYGKSPDDDDEVYYNDLFILNTETFVWKKAMTTGIPPSPRESHSCSTWKNKMIVIGGEDGRDYHFSDVHILDTDTLMWKELTTTGDMLPPRAGHLTVSFGKILFVYGGYMESRKLYDDLYMLDVESAIWSKVTASGAGPSARFSMAGDCLDPDSLGTQAKAREATLEEETEAEVPRTNLTLRHDKALVQVGVTTSSYQPVKLSICGQPGSHSYPFTQSEAVQGKSMFQARVTENYGNRFTMETVIDGKPLRGILFFNERSTHPIPFLRSSRKRTFGDSRKNGDYNCESLASRSIQPDLVADGQADDVRGEEASPQEPHGKPAGPVPVSDVLQPSDGSDLDKMRGH